MCNQEIWVMCTTLQILSILTRMLYKLLMPNKAPIRGMTMRQQTRALALFLSRLLELLLLLVWERICNLQEDPTTLHRLAALEAAKRMGTDKSPIKVFSERCGRTAKRVALKKKAAEITRSPSFRVQNLCLLHFQNHVPWRLCITSPSYHQRKDLSSWICQMI